MTERGEIVGELLQKTECTTTIEWKVKDIFSYTEEDQEYTSPTFTLPGSQWFLSMYPNGKTADGSVGWIYLHLCRLDELATPKSVNFKMYIQTIHRGSSHSVTKDLYFLENKSSEGINLISRPQLLEREDYLTTSGDLTLFCTLTLKDCSELISRSTDLSDSLENMFISKRGCDATLKVKDKDFPVHRSILIERSPALGANFEVDMEEKNTGVVNIVDCDPEAFKDFLRYIYTDRFIISSKDVFELYRIAHKYNVEKLKLDCVDYMINSLSADTFFDTHNISQQFDETELGNIVQDFFNREYTKVILTEKWDVFLKENFLVASGMLKNMAAKNNCQK